jgi:hypothetical protein
MKAFNSCKKVVTGKEIAIDSLALPLVKMKLPAASGGVSSEIAP